MPGKSKCLIIGGQFTGNFCARDLKKQFHVTVVDAKEYFEYTPGILRAYVKPCHLDALTFTLQPVYERRIGVKFIWGEVKTLKERTATIKTMFSSEEDEVGFDYCVICSGCNFGPFNVDMKPSETGESLWFPTVHEFGRSKSEWAHIDERFIEGRRRHILEEYHKLIELEKKEAKILVAGAGFIGVEWVTELEYFFPKMKLAIIDFLPRILGPLPDSAAGYCSEYMAAAGIKEYVSTKYEPSNSEFWNKIDMPDKSDCTYLCMGFKASNYFMPQETLARPGLVPGGGGWIHINNNLQVCKAPAEDAQKEEIADSLEDLKKESGPGGKFEFKPGETWADGHIFAVGDCNFGCVGRYRKYKKEGDGPPGMHFVGDFPIIPKISYPGEEQALHAVRNMQKIDKLVKRGYKETDAKLVKSWWPWGAGMFATSLGPHDAAFVVAANEKPKSGYMVNWWYPAALQKEIIETTKIDECRDRWIGILIWHFVHHTPVHLFGRGPCCGI